MKWSWSKKKFSSTKNLDASGCNMETVILGTFMARLLYEESGIE